MSGERYTAPNSEPSVLAIIPARGGSKGLPGKNIRPFLGKPLIAHTIAFANACPGIDRCVVTTDSKEIAEVAMRYGGDVPFIRPSDLALDTTPMIPVLRHALETVERTLGRTFDTVLLLDPTSPGRIVDDVSSARTLLSSDPSALGVVAVSRPTFNPFWVGVVQHADLELAPAFPGESNYVRRQDVPPFLRINGALYLWRRSYVLEHEGPWFQRRHLGLEIPEIRAFSIDDLQEFRLAEYLVASGTVDLPWMRLASP